MSSASLITTSVVHELDPQQKTNFLIYDLLIAATVCLAFIGEPELAIGASGIASAMLTAGQNLLTGLKEAPLVGRTIWPKGTVDSQLVQIGNIQSSLGNMNKQIGSMLNQGLSTIMSDAATFALFASAGQFSGASTYSLPKNTAGLDLALKTFITSNAMTQNDWYAYPVLWMSRDEISSAVDSGNSCTWGPDNYDICWNSSVSTALYYSNYTGIAYYLWSKPGAKVSNSQLMLDIVNNEWSTLPALFDGAFNCTAAGNSAQPFSVQVNGTVDLSCVSQLNICMGGCGGSCPVPFVNGTCPFQPCHNGCDN